MGGAGSPQTPPEPLVSAHDLSVGYSDEPVCAPATFNLLPGQVLALVGVNGAGKSTILRTCCGLLHPLRGEVRVLGHVPDPRSGAQRAAVATDLGQESFFPTLTVAEHLRLVCFGHGVADADDSTLARTLYSSDASLYRVPPQVVVRPRHTDEVLAEAGYSAEEIAAMLGSGAAAGPDADSASTFRA